MTRITPEAIRAKKARGERITMLTAYDYSLAAWVDRAGVDIMLVGDSLGMVVLGYETTAPVTMAEMLPHAQAVGRAVQRALVVGDLPKAALDSSPREVLACAQQFLEAGCGAVKLEWRANAPELARHLITAGIAVMGHVGLTPQAVSDPTQFRVQGKTAHEARQILDAADTLEAVGCFSLVVECVPAEVAQLITQRLSIPTIGIGAGAACDGQVLVLHDLLGLYPRLTPTFAKQYAHLGETVVQTVQAFCADVQAQRFPAAAHTFHLPPSEAEQLRALIAEPHRLRT